MREDWIECKLGDVIEIISGKNQKNVLNSNGKYPIYGSGGIIGRADEYLCDSGSTIIGRKGTINSPIYVKEKFWNVDTAFGFYPFEILSNRLLYFFCLSFNFKALDKSTTIPSLAKRDLLQIEFSLPPFPIQKAIVKKVEELFSSLDSGITDLKKAQEQLVIYRQAVLKKAFEGELTKDWRRNQNNSLKWEIVKLGKILKVSSGKGLTSANMTGEGYPVYGGNGITGYHSEYLYGDQKLIIGRVGVKCGVTHITKEKCWITDNALIVTLLSPDLFNLYFLKLKLQFENLNKLSNSTAQPVISGTSLYAYEVNLPTLEEQTQIVREIESRLSVCDKIEESLKESLEKAKALRQSILKKAFEGKLLSAEELAKCKADKDYEPACVLLERIKKEKNKKL